MSRFNRYSTARELLRSLSRDRQFVADLTLAGDLSGFVFDSLLLVVGLDNTSERHHTIPGDDLDVVRRGRQSLVGNHRPSNLLRQGTISLVRFLLVSRNLSGVAGVTRSAGR